MQTHFEDTIERAVVWGHYLTFLKLSSTHIEYLHTGDTPCCVFCNKNIILNWVPIRHMHIISYIQSVVILALYIILCDKDWENRAHLHTKYGLIFQL